MKYLKNKSYFEYDCLCALEIKQTEELYEKGVRMVGRIKSIRESAGIPKRFLNKNFSNYDFKNNPKAYRTCINYARNFPALFKEGRGLYMAGGIGTGKTHLAVAIIDYIARMHKRKYSYNILFRSVVDLVAELKARLRNNKPIDHLIKECEVCDLLILDDIGVENETEWTTELFYKIINTRYTNMLPVVITTNLHPEQMDRNKTQRVISRIMECCQGVEFDGIDYRKEHRGGKGRNGSRLF